MFRTSLLVVFFVSTLVGLQGVDSVFASEAHQNRSHAISVASEATPPPSQNGKEEYWKLEDELKRLLEELKLLEKDVENKVQQEIIPFLKKEIEKIRERIRRFRMDEKQPQDERTIRT